MMNEAERYFLKKLESLVHKHIEVLEAKFGRCDDRFVFGTVWR